MQFSIKADRIAFDFGQGVETRARTPGQKLSAFNLIANHINTADERQAVAQLDAAAMRQDFDPGELVAQMTLSEAELTRLSLMPLVSLMPTQ